MTVKKYSDLEREQASFYADKEQRRVYTAALLRRFLPPSAYYSSQPSDFLPVPWYGRLRQWLSGWLREWAETLESWGREVDYRPRLKNPPPPIRTGTSVQWRKFADLTPSTPEQSEPPT